MAPPKHPWFRFYCEALTDRKLRRLTPAQRWLWVAVLAVARQSPEPGVLLIADDVPATVDDLAELAGVKIGDARVGLERMATLGLIEGEPWRVTKWKERQFESDTSTARTRKHRSGTGPGTPMERSRIGPEAETETETDAEGVLSTTAAAVTTPGGRQQRIDEACRALAHERAQQRDVGPGWAPAAARGLATDHHQALHTHLLEHPDADRNELMALMDAQSKVSRPEPPNPSSRIPAVAEVLAGRPAVDPDTNAEGHAQARAALRGGA